MRDWRVEVLLQDGETRAQWEARCMHGKPVTNFGVTNMSVQLVKRA